MKFLFSLLLSSLTVTALAAAKPAATAPTAVVSETAATSSELSYSARPAASTVILTNPLGLTQGVSNVSLEMKLNATGSMILGYMSASEKVAKQNMTGKIVQTNTALLMGYTDQAYQMNSKVKVLVGGGITQVNQNDALDTESTFGLFATAALQRNFSAYTLGRVSLLGSTVSNKVYNTALGINFGFIF